jgi:hypothetical protein
MKTIWKYSVKFTGDGSLEHDIPEGAVFLAMKVQHDDPHIWYLVDTDQSMKRTRFQWFGTGHDMQGKLGPHRGTILSPGGIFVWHLFELLG